MATGPTGFKDKRGRNITHADLQSARQKAERQASAELSGKVDDIRTAARRVWLSKFNDLTTKQSGLDFRDFQAWAVKRLSTLTIGDAESWMRHTAAQAYELGQRSLSRSAVSEAGTLGAVQGTRRTTGPDTYKAAGPYEGGKDVVGQGAVGDVSVSA